MPKKQKQIIHERRDPQGHEWVMLVDSPHWMPGMVLQTIIHEWWYDHPDCIAEFKANCEAQNCTLLVSQPAPKCEDGRGRYLTDAEIRQALKVRGLLTPERAKRLDGDE